MLTYKDFPELNEKVFSNENFLHLEALIIKFNY